MLLLIIYIIFVFLRFIVDKMENTLLLWIAIGAVVVLVLICAVSSENNAIASAQINGMTIQIL
jgi:hypothetical protein